MNRKARMKQLVTVIQYLSRVRTVPELTAIVRCSARALLNSDGATFILRDGNYCHYADEDAIESLWKGERFPMDICISGWAMLNRKATVIEDIYADPRIPSDIYRATFVKSLTMVPVRTRDPIGAIGFYWATPHRSDDDEVLLAQALADTTAVALENIYLQEALGREGHTSEARFAARSGSPGDTQEQVEHLEKLAKMCAWTGRIEHEEQWLTVDEYLLQRFGVSVSHGMSGEVLKTLEAELVRS